MTLNENAQPSSMAQLLHPPLFVMFLLLWLALMGLMLSLKVPLPESWRWAQGLFLASATATTLVAQARHLPAQNVVVAAVLIAFVGGVVQTVGATTGIPIGAFAHTNKFGPLLFDTLPGLIPLIWVVAIINSRGVARLILRPWQKSKLYGLRLIGLTCLLTVLFDFGLEPFAPKASHSRIWEQPETTFTWYTSPWINLVGWAITTLLILTFATPWFIDKRSVGQRPDYHSLIVWVSLVLLFATASAARQLWLAAGIHVLAGALATAFALRGALLTEPTNSSTAPR
jgi:uncharacterized membrane protein